MSQEITVSRIGRTLHIRLDRAGRSSTFAEFSVIKTHLSPGFCSIAGPGW